MTTSFFLLFLALVVVAHDELDRFPYLYVGHPLISPSTPRSFESHDLQRKTPYTLYLYLHYTRLPIPNCRRQSTTAAAHLTSRPPTRTEHRLRRLCRSRSIFWGPARRSRLGCRRQAPTTTIARRAPTLRRLQSSTRTRRTRHAPLITTRSANTHRAITLGVVRVTERLSPHPRRRPCLRPLARLSSVLPSICCIHTLTLIHSLKATRVAVVDCPCRRQQRRRPFHPARPHRFRSSILPLPRQAQPTPLTRTVNLPAPCSRETEKIDGGMMMVGDGG